MPSTAVSLPLLGEAPPRKPVSAARVAMPATERDRNGIALRCLNAAIDAYRAAHAMKQETLAAGCGYSAGNFSRMLSGRHDQSFPLPLLDRLPEAIVADFLARMQAEHEDPLVVAAEQLISASTRFLSAVRGVTVRRRSR